MDRRSDIINSKLQAPRKVKKCGLRMALALVPEDLLLFCFLPLNTQKRARKPPSPREDAFYSPVMPGVGRIAKHQLRELLRVTLP